MKTIPDHVIEKIVTHRPHLAALVDNLLAATDPQMVRLLEKRLADAYLSGMTKLSPLETWYLAHCCGGEPYGGRRE